MIPVHITEEEECIASGNNAIKLYNLGKYGIPMKGGALKLSKFEVLHLLEIGKIKLNPYLSITQTATKFCNSDLEFMSYYLIYKDLRFRGYMVGVNQGSPLFFRLYNRGQKKDNLKATHYVYPLREGQKIAIDKLKSLLMASQKSSKSLVVGLVDAGGDVSYMKTNMFQIIENKLFNKV